MAATTSLVELQPRWLQREEWRQALYDRQRRDYLEHGLGALPVADLAAVTRMATLAGPSLEIIRGTVMGYIRPGPDSSIFLWESVMTSIPPIPMPSTIPTLSGE